MIKSIEDLIVGREYFITAPEEYDSGEVHWVEDMDYLDGETFILEKKQLDYFTPSDLLLNSPTEKGLVWTLTTEWLTLVEKEGEEEGVTEVVTQETLSQLPEVNLDNMPEMPYCKPAKEEDTKYLKCIKSCAWDHDESDYFIFKGKEYPVIGSNGHIVTFLNEKGNVHHWSIHETDFKEHLEFVEAKVTTSIKEVFEELTPVKSDGGSSDYYKIILPEWLLEKQQDQGFIMLEDLAEIIFKNEFNYTNIFKAQKRMFELEQGAGKCGNSLEYDAKKCKYYTDKQVEKFERGG